MLKNLLLFSIVCSIVYGQQFNCWGSYQYPDGSCTGSCRPPLTVVSTSSFFFCNSPCASDLYLYPNGSCLSTCGPEFSSSQDRGVILCNPLPCKIYTDTSTGYSTTDCSNQLNNCSKSQFQLEDGNCTSVCEPPLTPKVQDGSAYCNSSAFSCGWYNYEYPDGSCSTQCLSPFVVTGYFGYFTCENPCVSGLYLYPNGSCLATCDPGFIPKVLGSTLVCEAPACTVSFNSVNQTPSTDCTNIGTNCSPSQFQLPNGSCTSSCSSPMHPVIRDGSAYCESQYYSCAWGDSRNLDGSCVPACNPMITDGSVGWYVCQNPCAADLYLYENSSCLATCNPPFIPTVKGSTLFCETPACKVFSNSPTGDSFATDCPNIGSNCAESLFQLADGTCSVSCQSPMFPSVQSGSAYCKNAQTLTSPCPFHYYNYPDGTCGSSCDSPLVPDSYPDWYAFGCASPCANDQYLYQNQSCLPTCDPVFIARSMGPALLCEDPNSCAGTNNYRYANGSCFSTCGQGYTVRQVGSIRYCDAIPYCTISGPSNHRTTNCTNLWYTNHWGIGSCPPGQFEVQSNGCGAFCSSTCSSTCNSPMIAFISYGTAFCNTPCGGTYSYLYENGTCSSNCGSRFIPIHGNQMYYCNAIASCVISGTKEYPTNNCTNVWNNGCPEGLFKFEDYSCKATCEPPFIPTIVNGSAFCNFPCEPHTFFYPNGSCLSRCGSGFMAREQYPYLYCDAIQDCVLTGAGDYSTNNCTNVWNSQCQSSLFQGGYCIPICQGSCLPFCQSPLVPVIINGTAFCNSPCAFFAYLYPNGSCLSLCGEGFTVRDEYPYFYCDEISPATGGCSRGLFQHEDKSCSATCFPPLIPKMVDDTAFCFNPCPTGSYRTKSNTCQQGNVNIQVYIRYNIPLADFNAQDGSNRFVLKLSTVLGIDSSTIKILSVTEGSTIIDSQIAVSAPPRQDSLDSILAQAQTINNKLTEAYNNNDLVFITGANVLDFRHSIVINTSDGTTSSNKKLIIGLAVGLGLLTIVLAVTGLIYYNKRKNFKLRSVREAAQNRNKEVVQVVPHLNQAEQEVHDGSWAGVRNYNQSSLPQGPSQAPEMDLRVEEVGSGAEKAEKERPGVDVEEKPMSLNTLLASPQANVEIKDSRFENLRKDAEGNDEIIR